jgi:hypothetical protein
MNRTGYKVPITFCLIFQFLTMFHTGNIVGAGAVGAGAVRAHVASCFGYGSDQMMRLLAAPAPMALPPNLIIKNITNLGLW